MAGSSPASPSAIRFCRRLTNAYAGFWTDVMTGNINVVQGLDLSTIETLVFAGGGNRCWWQAGALQHLTGRGMSLPANLVGTSAGAAVAASFLAKGTDAALEACLSLYAGNPKIFDWSALRELKLKFAHQHVYPTWIDAFVNMKTFPLLRDSSSRLTVALTRPARFLGMAGSIAAGTLAYLVDKSLAQPSSAPA